MQDIDKWPWVVQIAFLIGGGIAAGFMAVLGRKASQKPAYDEGSEERSLIREQQARLLAAEAEVAENRIRKDFEQALAATRRSFYDQSERFGEKIDDRIRDLEKRIHDLEMKRH